MMFTNCGDEDFRLSGETKAMMLIADLQAAAQRLLDHSPGAQALTVPVSAGVILLVGRKNAVQEEALRLDVPSSD